MNLVFGLLDRYYKIASTYNAIHNEFMKIKSMLIKNGYPKTYRDRCIMKYLNKIHEVPINSSKKTPMTTSAGFTCRLYRLKPRASRSKGGLKQTVVRIDSMAGI